MIPLRRKAASLLTDAAHEGIKILDPKSECAKALKKIDVDSALKQDIERICNAASFIEITQSISLAAQLRLASGEKRKTAKRELKKILEKVMATAESKQGKLKTPPSCRHLLLGL